MHCLTWVRSTYSPDGSNCVETAITPTSVLVRDSKDPNGPRLALLPAAWAHFAAHAATPSPKSVST